MKRTLTLPGMSPAVSQIITHFVAVFLVAFGTQLVAGASNAVNISTLLALLTSAAAAGVVAVGHIIAGLVPSNPTTQLSEGVTYNQLGIPVKVKTAGYQILTSAVITFVGVLGAQLIGGAAHVDSLPGIISVVIAAISAAVFAVVQYLVGLIPAPKA